MCARRMGEGRACPSPEAALTAAGPPAARVYGPEPASAAARWPPAPPPPPRARPCAPPLGLAAHGLRTRGGGRGLGRRAVGASQVVSPSFPEAGPAGGGGEGELLPSSRLPGTYPAASSVRPVWSVSLLLARLRSGW